MVRGYLYIYLYYLLTFMFVHRLHVMTDKVSAMLANNVSSQHSCSYSMDVPRRNHWCYVLRLNPTPEFWHIRMYLRLGIDFIVLCIFYSYPIFAAYSTYRLGQYIHRWPYFSLASDLSCTQSRSPIWSTRMRCCCLRSMTSSENSA